MKFAIALISAAAATKVTELGAGPAPLEIDPQLAALVADDGRPIADRVAAMAALPDDKKWELGLECHLGDLDCDAVGEAIEEYCTGEAGAEDGNCAILNQFIGELEALSDGDDLGEDGEDLGDEGSWEEWDTEAYCMEFPDDSWCLESEDDEDDDDEDSFDSYGMDTEEIEAYCDDNDWDSWCEEAEARAGSSDEDEDDDDEDSFDSYGMDTE